ncbi:MAG: hypothetical protein H7318_00050 [Oligoflexus sp.]|nr:hypothetical protein [Oligoflexus sp.]
MNIFLTSILVLVSATAPLLLPLARNLEYEYVSLVSYLLLALPLILYFLPKQSVPSPKRAGVQLLVSMLLTFIPAFIMFRTNSCQCSETDFRFWWQVQIFPHLLLSHAAAWLMLKGKSKKTKWVVPTYIVVVIGLFLQMAWTLWSMPQKRITHLLTGFIHGAIYDNGIGVDAGILYARLSHVFIALALLSLALYHKKLARILACAALILAIGTGWKAAQFPSTTHGIDALNELMPDTKSSRFFTLHYNKSKSTQNPEIIDQIFASAEFHTQDIAKKLLIYDTHVELYIYPSRWDKKLWFGGDGTDITDVKTPSVHIIAESWPHGTLRHELVHAMASSFAFFGLGFHPNMAFTEGLAVALAPGEEDISLHAGAAGILRSQQVDPVKLFSPMFWGESGRRAYTVAGSLITFLIDHYGIAKVKQLYAGSSWHDTFGKETETVLGDWKTFLEQNYADKTEDLTAEAMYRYPGLLYDQCPHSKALLANSSKSYLNKLRQPDGWNIDKDYWPWRLTVENGPSTRLQVLRAEYFKKGATEELLSQVRKERQVPPRAMEDVEGSSLEFDILINLKRNDEAKAVIKKLLADLQKFKLGDGNMRQLWSRKVLSGLPGTTAKTWLALLSGQGNSVPGLDAAPSQVPWLLNYLYLRNHRFLEADRTLLDSLVQRPVPVELPNSFAVEWWKFIGNRRFELHDYEAASLAFQNAAAIAPEGSRDAILLAGEESLFALRMEKAKAHNVHH